ncbi:RNA polymerase sigma factor [Aquimarina muelleri]|uniref:RNA polymerase sigma factor n=1 Tax=Aquimarina muelleri TaxID=279356 RepID=A0A918JUM6_9FLAO|nr:RNA polymerase sigma factor [Aquimarina muelleri]MCX2764855.1 RNA polymerase sigma factor [Aquimarina muelleri]GGX14857.1 DNA-directed RNA polymerase sigma-70 factor [Aquimarina muelleri]
MNTQNEQDLLTALKSDINSSFSKLVTLYQERLYWHIRNIVKNHHDTDDILQNVYIKVYNNINNFKGDSKLYSWLYRIATNESITFLNKKAKKDNITNEELSQKLIQNLEADVYYDGSQIELKLQKAIATLPQKQQIVFNMKYFQELKYKEISEILQTSVGALKASYHIATKKIEEFLKND